MVHKSEDESQLRRRLTKEAVNLAMESRWEEAVAVNRAILESFPTDVDALNRLGRALVELGEFAQAREIYTQALELHPDNKIAKKNLDRLSVLKESQPPLKSDPHRLVPDLFIQEVGKAGVVNLFHLAPKEVLAKMVAGDQVQLKVKGKHLVVINNSGEELGEVDSKHGLRLLKLIEGGNQYAAAIASINEDEVKVIIKEIFQHPSQAGHLSFPVKAIEGFRPYARPPLLRYKLEPEMEGEEEEAEYPQWEEELLPDGFSIVEEVGSEEITKGEE